jgi:diguanylate cyclase (GGDEF)-like protein
VITLIRRLGRLPAGWLLLCGLLVVAAIAWFDTATSNVQLGIFYLLPVALVAWCARSSVLGLVVAIASAAERPVDALLSHSQPISVLVACWNGAARLAIFCVVLWLLSRMRALLARLGELALTDELTGLANLRAFRDIAAHEVERCRRYHHQLSLAYVDIDDLKAVNDCHGHAQGDRALRALAAVLLANMRSVDTIARVGGDEFVVLMPETSATAAVPLARRVLAALPREVRVAEGGLTCSIGLVTFGRAPDSVRELVGAADRLMYEAKAKGKNALRQRIVEVVPREARSDARGVGTLV